MTGHRSRRGTIIPALLAVIAMATTAAGAKNGPPTGTTTGAAVTVNGPIEIAGSGIVALEGDVVATGSSRGRGALLIVQDLRGGAELTVNGVSRHLVPHRALRVATGGRAVALYVSGTRVRLRIQASSIHLSAFAQGRATLVGTGTVILNGGAPTPWPTGGGTTPGQGSGTGTGGPPGQTRHSAG